MIKTLLRLPRTVWLLGLVSFFNDATSDMIYPLVPIYLTSALMAGPKALGIIEGIGEAAASLLKLFSGVWADRVGKGKYWVVGGYGLAVSSRPFLALAASWPVVLMLRFADRAGKGLRSSPRDAILARAVPAEQRGLAFGFHRAMDNTGAVIGPLTAAALLARHTPLRDIFLWSALPGAITLALAMSIREPQTAGSAPARGFGWSLRDFPPSFKRYLAVLALFTLGNSSNMFLLLRARDLGIPDYQVPLLWAAVSLSAALFSTPLAALSDRVGRVRLIVAGWGVYGLFYAFMGVSGARAQWLWPLFAFYGLFMAATEGAEKALVADMAPGPLLGTAYGWFNMTAGVMLLPASFLFGGLWQTFGAGAAFGFGAGCAVLAALLLIFWVPGRGKDIKSLS